MLYSEVVGCCYTLEHGFFLANKLPVSTGGVWRRGMRRL
jgi:hypothetical protein